MRGRLPKRAAGSSARGHSRGSVFGEVQRRQQREERARVGVGQSAISASVSCLKDGGGAARSPASAEGEGGAELGGDEGAAAAAGERRRDRRRRSPRRRAGAEGGRRDGAASGDADAPAQDGRERRETSARTATHSPRVPTLGRPSPPRPASRSRGCAPTSAAAASPPPRPPRRRRRLQAAAATRRVPDERQHLQLDRRRAVRESRVRTRAASAARPSPSPPLPGAAPWRATYWSTKVSRYSHGKTRGSTRSQSAA